MSEVSKSFHVSRQHDDTAPSPFEQFEEFLERRELEFKAHNDKGIISLWIYLPAGTLRVFVKIEQPNALALISVLVTVPLMIPESRRQAVAEAIQRLSYGETIAAPELDFNDGEIRFKSQIVRSDGAFTDAEFEYLLMGNLTLASSLLEPLLAVGFGRVSPASLIVTTKPESSAGHTLQ